MPQAIKYQDTKVPAERTTSSLAELVRKYGGSRFELQWDAEGNPTAVRFALRTSWGEVPVRLEAKTQVIAAKLRLTRHFSESRAIQQAHRIAWRIIHDTAEQLLLQVSLGITDVGSAFMAGVEVEDYSTGEVVTMGELLSRHAALAPNGRALRLLSAGSR